MVKNIRKKFSNRLVLLAATAALLVVVAAIWLVFWHSPKKTTTIPSTTPVSVAPAISSDKQPASTAPSSSDSTKSSSASTSAVLITPYGTFVSNHHPGVNGAPTAEVSVCNTTPGASCYIQFTKGSEVQKLAAQTADSTGATYWNWDANSASLGSGAWQILAVASLNGQTKTAADATTLNIQ